MSKQRKPGDYVVNVELTEGQIEAFVRDCVANGATSDGDHLYTNFTAFFTGGASVGGWYSIQRFCTTNVTEEYKEQPMTTLDLPTVLEECAEHIRAGRDPRDYFEINATENGSRDGFIRPNNLSLLLNDAFNVRRKPTHKTPTEDDVGRLVMVRNAIDDPDEWEGPHYLVDVDKDSSPYVTANGSCWQIAKLYQGPTRPNWIEHNGRGVPDEVRKVGEALVQFKNGTIDLADYDSLSWGESSIARYTIIEP